MKKRTIILLIVLGIIVVPIAVVAILAMTADKVVGEGDMLRRPYDVEDFDSVEIKKAKTDSALVSFAVLGSDFELIYRSGQENKVEIEAQENLFDYIQVSVKEGTLILENSKPIKTEEERRPKLYITMPQMNKMIIHGNVLFKDADKIQGEKLDINVSGFCDMDLDLEVNSLEVNMSGDGTVKLRGGSQYAKVDLSGMGKIDAMELETVDTEVNISGLGDCDISCSGTLKANASGVGKLRYKGSPELTENKTRGTIEKVD